MQVLETLRNSGCIPAQVPGAGIQPPLSPESIHSGAATSTITRLGPFKLNFELNLTLFFYRSWSSFRGL